MWCQINGGNEWSNRAASVEEESVQLTAVLAEHDGQFASLNQTAVVRDEHLEEAKAILQSERDKAIKLLTKLNDKVTARENTLSIIHEWYGSRIISWSNNIALFIEKVE